jgi:hypothetical protein
LRLIRGGADGPRERVFLDAEAEPPALAREAERDYARAALQRQVEGGATVLVAPYHLAGDLVDPGRQLDLRVARHAARLFREARLGDPGRELHAALRVGVETLSDPLARAGLVAAYAELDVARFLVKVDGFLADVDACWEFVYSLELQARRPVEVVGEAPAGEPARRAEARVRRRLAQSG